MAKCLRYFILQRNPGGFSSTPPQTQIKAFLSLPSCHLHEASLTPQCRQQTQAPSPTPGAAVCSLPSSPTPDGGEEAAGGRKEEQHLETGRPGTWERVRSPHLRGREGNGPWEGLAQVGGPRCSGEDRVTALPCYGAAGERKQAGGQFSSSCRIFLAHC